MKSRRGQHLFAVMMLLLLVAQGVVILGSWLITAILPSLQLHSLLSSEGIRWFFGQFSYNLASPIMVWMLVATMGYGCITTSGLLHLKRPLDFRQRLALRFVVSELVVLIAVLVLLTLLPHAVLLNIDGHLFPSSFSDSIIPYLSFSACIMGVSYAFLSGHITSLVQTFSMLCSKFDTLSPLFVLYIAAAQLFCSIRFVLTVGAQ